MSMAFQRYEHNGIPVTEYVNQMETNRERFLENIETTELTDADRAFFSDGTHRFLVITEDWCADSVQFIPALVRLTGEVETVDLRLIRRSDHQDLAQHYISKQGYQPIPVVIAFDEDGNEIAALLERPEQASVELAEETRRFQEANPELDGIKRNVDRMPEETRAKVKAHSKTWRVTQQDRFVRYFLDELKELVAQGRRATASASAD